MPGFSHQRATEEAGSQDRKLLDSNHSALAKHHRKGCGPIPTHASKDLVGNLDFPLWARNEVPWHPCQGGGSG